MALDRKQSWFYKDGDFGVKDEEYSYMGGSPVLITNGEVSANISETGFNAVAMDNREYDVAVANKSTVIFAPADLTLEKGVSQASITTYDDITEPWDSSQSMSMGDLLRPKQRTVGSVVCSVWTNEKYATATTGFNVYPAKIIGMTGSGTAVTDMRILVGVHTKVDA